METKSSSEGGVAGVELEASPQMSTTGGSARPRPQAPNARIDVKRRAVKLHFLAACALGPAIALAQSPPERDGLAIVAEIEKTLVDVIAAVEPSVVAISRVAGPQQQANNEQSAIIVEAFGDLQPAARSQAETVAAGVIIDPAGLVLTEFLAVRKGDTHSVTLTNGETYPAEIKAADPRSGLAVLAIKTKDDEEAQASFPAVHFGNADELRKGQFVLALGNPYAIRTDGQPTASWGIVTNLARKAPAGTNLNNAPGPSQDYRTTVHHLGTLIQTDAALGWSASGGALVNLRGELVGLTTTASAIAGHEQPAGYAIPMSATFRRIIDTLKEGREVEYGLLGVNLGMSVPTGGNAAEPRVVVQHAYAGSPGDLAGLKMGDVLLGVNGKPVHDVDQLQLSVSLLPPSTETIIEYARGGNSATTRVKLAKLGVTGGKIVTNRPPAWRGIHVDYATAIDAFKLAQAIDSKAIDPAGCVLVVEVEPESDAAKAGIQAGKFISHVGGKRVRTPAEFFAAAQSVGSTGEKLDIKLTQPVQPPDENDAGAKNPGGEPPQP